MKMQLLIQRLRVDIDVSRETIRIRNTVMETV